MAETFIAACVQTTSLPDPAVTMDSVGPLIRGARAAGADFITTPEVVSMLGPRPAVMANAQPGSWPRSACPWSRPAP